MMHVEGVSVALACEWAGVSRSGFYRDYEDHAPREADNSLRDAIQQIVLEHRFYGYRRVAAELRTQGWVVNHKRVLRVMRADNLLCLRKRKYVLTTDSHHPFAIYPNLLPRLVVNGINQLWVADITYIRLRETFLYLAVILDAWSRRVVGWHLGETLEAELAVKALDRALAERPVQPGLVHHSDRGIQYCSDAYVNTLEEHGFLISMSRTANPYDNAKAERFMRTLKCEEVYLQQYRDAEHARTSIGKFLEEVYNRKRLHSALGYKTPTAFETALASSGAEAGREPQEGVFQA
jgi:putative transposase